VPNYAQATILGHLGRDVETKQLPSGKALHEFSVAVTDGSGEKKVTSWYNVKIWGDLIQWKLDELKKGALVMVAGRLSIETWEAKDGTKGSKVVVTADAFSGVNVFGNRDEVAGDGIVSRPRSAQGAQPEFDTDDLIPF
jgi:single-strand DNA-binding protein